MSDLNTCAHCRKEISPHLNYCDWDCQIAAAVAGGGKTIAPNGLPIFCITAAGDLLEHEHADHPDYKFPVLARFVGPLKADYYADYRRCGGKDETEDKVREFLSESHALLYTDGSIALTLFEHCYSLWLVADGTCCSSWHGMGEENWRLDVESLNKIRNICGEKR